MAISVGFTSASKRENSTLQLQMTETHNCTFKNGCSMLNPTLLLELNTATFPTYTNFKIDNRYYNVRDIRSVRNNLFEITGEVDVLATYKANILATTAYVIYDTVPNTELVDNRLPMKTSKSVLAATAACPLVPDGGCYILSLTGSNDSTGIYKVNLGELRALIDDVSDVMNNIFDYDQDPVRPSYPSPPSTAQTTMQALVDTFEYFCDSFKLTVDYIIEWTKWWADAIRLPFSQFFGSGRVGIIIDLIFLLILRSVAGKPRDTIRNHAEVKTAGMLLARVAILPISAVIRTYLSHEEITLFSPCNAPSKMSCA